jgi:hypothetical protein
MKDKNEIIKEMEDEILSTLEDINSKQHKVNALQTCVKTLRGPVNDIEASPPEISEPNNLLEYPGYPIEGPLLEKLRYLEDITLRVWKVKYMEKLIRKIEGEDRSRKLLIDFRKKVSALVTTKQMINLKYNDSLKYCFFTTRHEWVEIISEGFHKTYKLKPEHGPEKKDFGNLPEDKRGPESITWRG